MKFSRGGDKYDAFRQECTATGPISGNGYRLGKDDAVERGETGRSVIVFHEIIIVFIVIFLDVIVLAWLWLFLVVLGVEFS